MPLDEIAKSAALANATLYRHFPSRAELIVAVYATELEELRQASEELLDRSDRARPWPTGVLCCASASLRCAA